MERGGKRLLRSKPPVDFRNMIRDNFIEGGMTAPPRVVATRNRVLTTAQALDRALRQAEFDVTAIDSAPFISTSSDRN
jgi:hypothetical protein